MEQILQDNEYQKNNIGEIQYNKYGKYENGIRVEILY